MESEPHVEARPPALIESAVRLLVPPIAREHVLGDLAERYSSPRQYLLEAARTVPFVVVSQIRRTSYFVLWPMVAMMLTTGFGAGAAVSGRHGVIPALAAMIGFMFRDAYKVRDLQHPWRQGLVDVGVAVGSALASQAVVAAARPEWLIAPLGVVGGGAVFAVLYLLRVQNPGGRVPRLVPASSYPAMTFDQLRGEISKYDRTMRRGASIEIVAAGVMVPVFAACALLAARPPIRIGAGLCVAGLLFVIWYIRRGLKATVSIPGNADFRATVAGYCARLERHHEALRTIWLWYLFPLGVGPAVVIGAGAMAASRPLTAAIGPVIGFAVMWLTVAWINGRGAHALRQRITAIERVEEQR
jgi:hypothetical protein